MGYERMDEVVERMPIMAENHDEAKGMMPCSYCGVFRRQSLNALAEKIQADVMALGHNLDDMAQSILMNLQKGEIERSVRLAPHTDIPIEGLAPRIVPLRWVPEQEIHAYAFAKGLPIHHGDCPHAPGAMRQQSRAIVASLEPKVQVLDMDYYMLWNRLEYCTERREETISRMLQIVNNVGK